MTRLVELISRPQELLEAMALWVYSGQAHADGTVDRLIQNSLASPLPEQSAEAFAQTAQAAIAHDMGNRLTSLSAPTHDRGRRRRSRLSAPACRRI